VCHQGNRILKTRFENKIFENTILACIYEILFGAILGYCIILKYKYCQNTILAVFYLVFSK